MNHHKILKGKKKYKEKKQGKRTSCPVKMEGFRKNAKEGCGDEHPSAEGG